MTGVRSRLLITAILAGLAAGFAILNGGERVTLRLGFATVRSVPLSVVVFVSVVVGMLLVFAVGLRADLRTRRMLRRYREALGGEEWAGSLPDGATDEP
jgi:uncharacterized integral membrane protein